ncbi:MAG: 50S ribosomal protein L32 [Chlamydiales bacterium]|nr:50S ribosomal protein L32 [Chlamydiia bacterium]MCP5507041.1 50S ribosomal protein L32 [Chlamydiales bacterium]
MAVPRNRHSNSRKNMRRAHDAKKPKNTAACPNCNAARMPHMICQSCGHYGKRAVISVEE